MTLEVSLLGEEKKWKSWGHYTLASMISGGLSGFLYTLLIFVTLSWLPYRFKITIFTIAVGLYLLNEFKIIKLKLPQRQWQIPASWLTSSKARNMWIWGLILGAGIFTYMPFVTFYFLYVYIGLLLNPFFGLLFGVLYGFSRALPTIIVTLSNKELDMQGIVKLYKSKVRKFKVLNSSILILLFLYLILFAT